MKGLKKRKREQSKSWNTNKEDEVMNRTNVIQEESKATTYAEP